MAVVAFGYVDLSVVAGGFVGGDAVFSVVGGFLVEVGVAVALIGLAVAAKRGDTSVSQRGSGEKREGGLLFCLSKIIDAR